MTKFRCALAALLATGLLAGCGQGDVSIGEAGSKAVIGGWTGYIENFKFASGSDALQITVDGASGDQLTGHAIFGAGPMLPPPTDPDVGYPPSGPYAPSVNPPDWNRSPAEGFAFTLFDATLSGDRLRFTVYRDEIVQAWCELQKPVPSNAASGYGCLPKTGGSIGNVQGQEQCSLGGQPPLVQVDCGKLEICSLALICQCTAARCTGDPRVWGNPTKPPSAAFDLSVTGGAANGSEIGVDDGQHNVHLTHGQ